MKTAIEKPMTPGGVFDHLMEPQGDEPEFLPSKDPKTMTMQEALEKMGRFLRWNRTVSYTHLTLPTNSRV